MVAQKYRWDFIGLSTDVKPTPATSDKVVDGSTFYCSDNSKLYVYCKNQWYERKPLGGGGGGGGSYIAGTGIDITDDTISVDTDTIQEKLTAGSNVTISDNTISATDTTYTAGTNVNISDQNVISATDTTYSNFTGTDGTAAGAAGLVPAPATTDAGKFLKADGTWDTAGGGGGVTVVQTTGTSTTDVMSQNATSSLVYNDPGTDTKIAIGNNAYATMGNNAIEIGHYSKAISSQAIAIGGGNSSSAAAKAGAIRAIAIGPSTNVLDQDAIGIGGNAGGGVTLGVGSIGIGNGANTGGGKGCISLGFGSLSGSIETAGVVSVGNLSSYDASDGYGYNSSAYRLITGVYDGQGLHDAATVAQGNTLATSAPTTTTAGVLGQLYTDTTNMHTYQLTAIDTTDPDNPVYTWTQRW